MQQRLCDQWANASQAARTPLMRLALYTFGVLKAPAGSERLVDFAAMAPSVFEEAESTEGVPRTCHGCPSRPRGQIKFGEDFGSRGVAVAPRFFDQFSKRREGTMIA